MMTRAIDSTVSGRNKEKNESAICNQDGNSVDGAKDAARNHNIVCWHAR